MPAAPQPPISPRPLREAPLPPPPAPTSDRRGRNPQPDLDPGVAAMLPSADELLEASPNVQRLCDSYHRLHRHMVARSRRQKLGIAGLVAGVGVGTVVLSRSSNQISAGGLAHPVVAAAPAGRAAPPRISRHQSHPGTPATRRTGGTLANLRHGAQIVLAWGCSPHRAR